MSPAFQDPTNTEWAARVRQNTGSAAIAAALLVYFGFFRLLEPSGTDLFQRANWVLYHTLRIGGVTFGVVAVASLTGHPRVLLIDALASVLVGALLILTGVAMVIDGGGMAQTLINGICGALFLSAGARNLREYGDWVRERPAWARAVESPVREGETSVRGGETSGQEVERGRRPTPSRDAHGALDGRQGDGSPVVSLASRLRKRAARSDDTTSPPGTAFGTTGSAAPTPSPTVPIAPVHPSGVTPADPDRNHAASEADIDLEVPEADSTPDAAAENGGFLASFGDRGSPPST